MLPLYRILSLESGPATLLPLLHVPLLKHAPRSENEYKVITDSLGDFCHFYGDFSGYHLYMIASSYKKNIEKDSLIYDQESGQFSVSLSMTLDNGLKESIHLDRCQAPLAEMGSTGPRYPTHVTVEQFSPGNPDGIMFHFKGSKAKFKFSHNLIPYIPESTRNGRGELFNLNIEYIGKASGKDGSREIADRLGAGHSKESLILNEFLHKKTNRDAYAILFKPGRPEGARGLAAISHFLPRHNEISRTFPRDGSVPAMRLLEDGVSSVQIILKSPADYGQLYTSDCEPDLDHRFEFLLPRR
jgi:hypothetical protein